MVVPDAIIPKIMASLFKHRGSYYLSFYDKNQRPKRKQVPLKTKSKRVAEQLQRRYEDAYALGEYSPWENKEIEETLDLSSLGDAITAFMESRANLQPASIKKYNEVLSLFASFLNSDIPLTAIRTSHIEKFLNATNRKAITKRTYSTTVSPLFNWLLSKGVINKNPVSDIRLERVPSKFPRFLTQKDVDAVCHLLDELGHGWLSNVVQANVYLGLRLGELVNLEWKHVDLNRKTITVTHSKTFSTKSGKERVLPLAKPVLNILASLPNKEGYVFRSAKGKQLSKQYTSRKFRCYARSIGLTECNFHTTRHTAASWLAQAGCSIEAIRMYMGHSSVSVTQKYMHLSNDVFARQIEKAFND